MVTDLRCSHLWAQTADRGVRCIDFEFRSAARQIVFASYLACSGRAYFRRGEDLFDVIDGHSGEMARYHAAFLKPKGWDYKETIRRQFADILSLDLLVLDHAETEPTHRKQEPGLGLACAGGRTRSRG